MATDLERFRDHAREMADAYHKPECGELVPGRWGWDRKWVHPAPECGGCVTVADRERWRMLAGEAAAYLAREHEAESAPESEPGIPLF